MLHQHCINQTNSKVARCNLVSHKLVYKLLGTLWALLCGRDCRVAESHHATQRHSRQKTDFHLSKYVGKPCAQRPSTFAQFNFWTIVGVMSFESWMKSQHAAQRRSTNKQIVNYRSKSASCALSTLRLSQNSIFERLLGSCLLRAEHWPSVLITHLQKKWLWTLSKIQKRQQDCQNTAVASRKVWGFTFVYSCKGD